MDFKKPIFLYGYKTKFTWILKNRSSYMDAYAPVIRYSCE